MLQLSPVNDSAAMSPSAVDPRSRPTAVRATRWVTVCGADMFCAQIPSAGSGDTELYEGTVRFSTALQVTSCHVMIWQYINLWE
jgi:hypothetical protein